MHGSVNLSLFSSYYISEAQKFLLKLIQIFYHLAIRSKLSERIQDKGVNYFDIVGIALFTIGFLTEGMILR